MYRTDTRRPGLLTTMGIFSILVGSISLIFSGLGAIMWLYCGVNSIPPNPPAKLGPSMVRPYGGVINSQGLPKQEREAICTYWMEQANKLESRSATAVPLLLEDRRAMLDRLLAEAGRDAFPDDGSNLCNRVVLAQHVQQISQAETGPDGLGWLGSHTFATPTARIHLNNTTAFLKRVDGSTAAAIHGNASIAPDGKRHWCAAAVMAALDNVYSRSGGNLNALQAGALRDEIFAYLPPPQTDGDFTPVLISAYYSNRNLAVALGEDIFSAGGQYNALGRMDANKDRKPPREIWLLPSGHIADRKKYPHGVDPATGLPSSGPSFRPVLPGNPVAMMMLGLEALASAALATCLIILGIRTLTNHSCIRPHWFYALAKSLLVVIYLALTIWFFSSIPSLQPGQPGGSMRWGSNVSLAGVLYVGINVFLQIIYPLILIAVLRNRNVRDFAMIRGHRADLLEPEGRARAGRAMASVPGRVLLSTCAVVALLALIMHGMVVVRDLRNQPGWAQSANLWHMLCLPGILFLFCLCTYLALRRRRAVSQALVVPMALLLVFSMDTTHCQGAGPARQSRLTTAERQAKAAAARQARIVRGMKEIEACIKESNSVSWDKADNLAEGVADEGVDGIIALLRAFAVHSDIEENDGLLCWNIYLHAVINAHNRNPAPFKHREVRQSLRQVLPLITRGFTNVDFVRDACLLDMLNSVGHCPEMLQFLADSPVRFDECDDEFARLLPTDKKELAKLAPLIVQKYQETKGSKRWNSSRYDPKIAVFNLIFLGKAGRTVAFEWAKQDHVIRPYVLEVYVPIARDDHIRDRIPNEMPILTDPKLVEVATLEINDQSDRRGYGSPALRSAVKTLLANGPKNRALIIDQLGTYRFDKILGQILADIHHGSALEEFLISNRNDDATKAAAVALLHILDKKPADVADAEILARLYRPDNSDELAVHLLMKSDLRDKAGPALQEHCWDILNHQRNRLPGRAASVSTPTWAIPPGLQTNGLASLPGMAWIATIFLMGLLVIPGIGLFIAAVCCTPQLK